MKRDALAWLPACMAARLPHWARGKHEPCVLECVHVWEVLACASMPSFNTALGKSIVVGD
eukprot:364451-Chlamydomonas_euryale.AAC.13